MSESPPSKSTDALGRVTETGMRIRALTTMIHEISVQVTHPAKSPTKDAALTAATHVSTLLSRGVEEHNPTRAIGTSIRTVAVAAHVTVDSVDLVAVTDSTVIEDTIRQSTQSEAGLTPVQAAESETSFSDLLERSTQADPRSTTLYQHVANVAGVFNAFFRLDPRSRSGARIRIHLFIARQCAPIISHRLRCYRFVFTEPLYDILEDWKPSESDHLVYKTNANRPDMFSVDGILHRAAERQGIRSKESKGEKFYYEGTKETAPQWIQLLCDRLRRAEQCFTVDTQPLPSNADIKDGVHALFELRLLLSLSWIKALIELESIRGLLQNAVNKFRGAKFSTPGVLAAKIAESTAEIYDAPDDAANPTSEEAAELAAVENETPTALTMRYLNNTLSWVSAVEYLAKSRIGHGPTKPHLNLCLLMTPPLSESAKMAVTLPFFVQAAETVRTDIPEDDCDKQQAYNTWFKQRKDFFSRHLAFKGTVHCEASLMAAMLDPTTGAGKSIAQFFKPPLDKKCAIGVSKKCCWCCARLASLIARCEGKTFVLPSSHGQILPWALPSGISQEVAGALEADLQSTLLEVLRKDFSVYHKRFLSQTISPAGSDDETYSPEFIDAYDAF